MSLSEIQNQAAALDPEDQRRLAAFLTVLRMKQSGEWDKAIVAESSDRTGWISLEDAKARLLRRN